MENGTTVRLTSKAAKYPGVGVRGDNGEPLYPKRSIGVVVGMHHRPAGYIVGAADLAVVKWDDGDIEYIHPDWIEVVQQSETVKSD